MKQVNRRAAGACTRPGTPGDDPHLQTRAHSVVLSEVSRFKNHVSDELKRGFAHEDVETSRGGLHGPPTRHTAWRRGRLRAALRGQPQAKVNASHRLHVRHKFGKQT